MNVLGFISTEYTPARNSYRLSFRYFGHDITLMLDSDATGSNAVKLLPEGWSSRYEGDVLIVSDEHSRDRIAADRHGVRSLRRYTPKIMYIGSYAVCHVLDARTSIWESEPSYVGGDYSVSHDQISETAEDWLDAHFPDWRDPLAYWD